MEGGIVAGEIDELVVVTQGIFQSPLPKPLRSRHLGQFFRIAHAEIVQQQACIAEVRLRDVPVFLGPRQRGRQLEVCRLGLGVCLHDQGRARRQRDQRQHGQDGGRSDDGLVTPSPLGKVFGEVRAPGEDRLAAEEPPQVVGKVLRRRIARGGGLCHGFQEDGFQAGRDRRVDAAGRLRIVIGDPAE